MAAAAALPEELLECIFKSLNDDNHTLKHLSVVSKQFLAITNRVRFSVTISDETIPFLPRLFHRFPNLTSLNLTILSKTLEEVDDTLTLISTFPLDIKSFNVSNTNYNRSFHLSHTNHIRPFRIPAKGLIALSKTMKNLKCLAFYGMSHFKLEDLFFIADYFPLLEELNLSDPLFTCSQDFMMDDNDQLLALPNLRRINLFGNHINDQFINFLRRNCKLLQEIMIIC
ncbi:unnamed protein product [Vicia faba]|uniref:F-box domain-containing protein n=1 Tax=Vicia faba TaxID=3906 RepID=A0AAV0ZV07_VICFA|nr:unnamed protein product [Vicia faba]